MKALFRTLPPSFTALLLQLAAFGIVLLSTRGLSLEIPPLAFAFLCGILAAVFSHLAGQAPWWRWIQLAFLPGVVVMLTFPVPPELFLLAFLVMLLVYWSTYRSQVPLYLSSQKVWQALATQLPQERTFSFVDLGSGLGGVLTYLSRRFPHGHFLGVEAAPLPWLFSWLRIRLGRHRQCAVHWGSLWDTDLGQFDIVFAYLSPVPMSELWHKAQREMRAGSLFISNTFTVPDHPPHAVLQIDDFHRSSLYLWRMG